MVAANFEWLAWFFLLLLAMLFVPFYLHTKISTMPEFLEHRFNSSCRSFLSWYTLFTTMILWLGGALYAGGLLLHQIMDWPLWVSVLLLVTVVSLSAGVCQLKDLPNRVFWPHYMLLSFYLFVGCVTLMIMISLCTNPQPGTNRLPTLSDTRSRGQQLETVWLWWGALGGIMGALYFFLN